MFDVTALGELLIDFTPYGKSDSDNNLYEQNPGGAPANVLSLISKLGGNTAFIGKVGDDQFGSFLNTTLKQYGIETKGLIFSKKACTTLAFVHINESGDRSFTFYRKPGADMLLNKDEINYDIINSSKIFHFGSISMSDEPSKTATIEALKSAKENKVLISYDPNLRIPLWDNKDTAKKTIHEGFKYADIVKISDDELEFLTGLESLKEGTKYLIDKYNTKLIFVTLGSKGCFVRKGNDIIEVPSYDLKAVDTTGAGDAFCGGALFKIVNKNTNINELNKEELKEIASFASAAGALAVTKRGAIPAMPSLEEINIFFNKR